MGPVSDLKSYHGMLSQSWSSRGADSSNEGGSESYPFYRNQRGKLTQHFHFAFSTPPETRRCPEASQRQTERHQGDKCPKSVRFLKGNRREHTPVICPGISGIKGQGSRQRPTGNALNAGGCAEKMKIDEENSTKNPPKSHLKGRQYQVSNPKWGQYRT